MPKDEHAINRKHDPDPDEQFACEECGEAFDSEEKLQSHRDREKREKLRGSPIGDAILGMAESRRRY